MISIFNNLPLEIKNVAGNQKKKNLKLLWKKFYTLTHFTHLKSALVNHELKTVSQDFIIVVCCFKEVKEEFLNILCLDTICK